MYEITGFNKTAGMSERTTGNLTRDMGITAIIGAITGVTEAMMRECWRPSTAGTGTTRKHYSRRTKAREPALRTYPFMKESHWGGEIPGGT